MSHKQEIGISSVLVAAPFVHVVVVSVYLFFYCIGFGANISSFLKIDDLFATSFQSIIRIYITSLAIPVVVVWLRYASGTPFATTAIDRFDGEARSAAEAHNNRMKRIILFGALVISTISIIGLAWNLYHGVYIGYFIFWQSNILLYYILIYRYKHRMGLTDFWHESVVIYTSLLISAASLGLDGGHIDRSSSYVDAIARNSRCDDGLIIRKIGDMYLSTMPDDSKALLSSECKILIFIPKPPIGYLK